MDNITEFQTHIRLVVQEPVKKSWQKMFLNIVTKVGPAGIVRPVHVIDDMGGVKQVHLRSYQMDDTFIYEVPLVRNLEEKEAEAIIKMWAKLYEEGDFVIETSTPYKDDDEVADDSDDITTCCEKAKLKHNKWMRNKVKEGYRYGLEYSEEEKTHPMLRPWDDLPPQYKQIDESSILGNVLQLREAPDYKDADEVLLGLKEKDPAAIQFAQSINMPPAVITQYGELAAQEDSMPRKVKIAVLGVEEQIVDFIEAALAKGTQKLGKEISRRGFMTGASNLAQALSTLTQAAKMMGALPKVEPKATPAPTPPDYAGWMTDEQILQFLPYEYHEEFLSLTPRQEQPLEDVINVANDWFKSRKLPYHVIDMVDRNDNANPLWKILRTKPADQGLGESKWFDFEDWYDYMTEAQMEDFGVVLESWDAWGDPVRDPTKFLEHVNEWLTYELNNSMYELKVTEVMIGDASRLNRGQIPEMKFRTTVAPKESGYTQYKQSKWMNRKEIAKEFIPTELHKEWYKFVEPMINPTSPISPTVQIPRWFKKHNLQRIEIVDWNKPDFKIKWSIRGLPNDVYNSHKK